MTTIQAAGSDREKSQLLEQCVGNVGAVRSLKYTTCIPHRRSTLTVVFSGVTDDHFCQQGLARHVSNDLGLPVCIATNIMPRVHCISDWADEPPCIPTKPAPTGSGEARNVEFGWSFECRRAVWHLFFRWAPPR